MATPIVRPTTGRAPASSECQAMSSPVKSASLILIILIFVTVAIMVATLFYNHFKIADTVEGSVLTADDPKDNKRKMVGWLTTGSAILGVITAIVAIWQFSTISKAVKVCLV